jgi:predicted ArsR family transcriptional regulator
MMTTAEPLAVALRRARVDADELRRIGAEWGRYLSGRPGEQDPAAQLAKVLTRLGYRVQTDPEGAQLERCACPLVSPDAPLNICVLIEGVIEGALAAAGSRLQIGESDHRPEARSCRLRLAVPD